MKIIASNFTCFCLLSLNAFCIDSTVCLFPSKFDKKWGYVDINDNIKIPPKYDSALFFSEHLALVKVDSLWGFINKEGDFVIPPKFLHAESFSCGLAKVNSIDPKFPTVFINSDGSIAFKSKYKYVYGFTYNRAIVKEEKNIFYIDKTGKTVIKTKYPYGDLFYDGIALIWNSEKAEFIDTAGQRIAYFNEMGHQNFNEGLAAVLGNTKTFYINKAGEHVKIIKRSFYIDKLGNIKMDNTIDSLVYFPFYNGIAEVCIAGSGHKSGFIDSTGKIILPIIYDYVHPFFGEYTTVYKSGKGSIINKKGEIVADFSEYEKYFPKHNCY